VRRIAVWASGSGTNAERLTHYFREKQSAEVAVILSNRPGAYVLERARSLGVHAALFPNAAFRQGSELLAFHQQMRIEYIILAGFLLKVPDSIVEVYEGKIINLHPALLPAFGGRGMYGMHVHRAVIDAGVKESGITIHLVNREYDEGEILFQASCPVMASDTPESLADRIHQLEYLHYPVIVEKRILGSEE
jgi:phosphoribosylglycinamide formyltransferase-1